MDDEREVSITVRNKRHNSKKRRLSAFIRNAAMTAVCIMLGIVITIQYRSINASSTLSAADADTVASLNAQILRLMQENQTLQSEIETKDEKLNILENATNDEQIEALEKELENLKKFAGTTQVTGRGVYISITVKEQMWEATLQRHLLRIINELKASTAQAISFNGERITAMSEIRVAGEYVVINGRQQSQPFEIYAIGNSQAIISGLILSGNGPLAILQEEGSCDIFYEARDEITINACQESDINTGLLKSGG